jgi:hypothetical protein
MTGFSNPKAMWDKRFSTPDLARWVSAALLKA